jgi:hypothetical protein
LIKYEFNNKYFSLIKLKSKLMSLQTRYPPHNLIFKKFITHFINQFQLAISTVKNKEFHVDAPFVSQWYLNFHAHLWNHRITMISPRIRWYLFSWLVQCFKALLEWALLSSWLYTDLTKLEWLYKLTHKWLIYSNIIKLKLKLVFK